MEEEESWFDLAHKSAKITSSSRGQMSIYSIFEGQAVCVCMRVHVCGVFSEEALDPSA